MMPWPFRFAGSEPRFLDMYGLRYLSTWPSLHPYSLLPCHSAEITGRTSRHNRARRISYKSAHWFAEGAHLKEYALDGMAFSPEEYRRVISWAPGVQGRHFVSLFPWITGTAPSELDPRLTAPLLQAFGVAVLRGPRSLHRGPLDHNCRSKSEFGFRRECCPLHRERCRWLLSKMSQAFWASVLIPHS